MSMVVFAKVTGGIAVAADSQRSRREWPSRKLVEFSLDAYKIYPIASGFPLGAAFYGTYMVGDKSIPQLMQLLTNRFLGQEEAYLGWKLNPGTCRLELVSSRMRDFIYAENYKKAFLQKETPVPSMSFQVFGYSAGHAKPEIYSVSIQEETGECDGPILLMNEDETGLSYGGDTDENGSKKVLEQLMLEGRFPSQIPSDMPLREASHLVELMVTETIARMRETYPEPTVGGPVDVAVISREQGFRWVRRKSLPS